MFNKLLPSFGKNISIAKKKNSLKSLDAFCKKTYCDNFIFNGFKIFNKHYSQLIVFTKKLSLFIVFFAFLQLSIQKSSAGYVSTVLPLPKLYVGAAFADYNDGNSKSTSPTNKLTNYKGILGLRIAGILSTELEYSKFNATRTDSIGSSNFDVVNYGFNAYFTPPILRVFGTGLEGIIGGGVNINQYKNQATGIKYNTTVPKAIIGARLIILEKIAIFATAEAMLKKPAMASNKAFAPVTLSVGANYFFM